MEHAVAARKKAYAPYSNFRVGAALQLENGKVVTGSNQENAAYPSGLCAERTAIYYAGAEYPDVNIIRMAITAGSTKQKTTSPISWIWYQQSSTGSASAFLRDAALVSVPNP